MTKVFALVKKIDGYPKVGLVTPQMISDMTNGVICESIIFCSWKHPCCCFEETFERIIWIQLQRLPDYLTAFRKIVHRDLKPANIFIAGEAWDDLRGVIQVHPNSRYL